MVLLRTFNRSKRPGLLILLKQEVNRFGDGLLYSIVVSRNVSILKEIYSIDQGIILWKHHVNLLSQSFRSVSSVDPKK